MGTDGPTLISPSGGVAADGSTTTTTTDAGTTKTPIGGNVPGGWGEMVAVTAE